MLVPAMELAGHGGTGEGTAIELTPASKRTDE